MSLEEVRKVFAANILMVIFAGLLVLVTIFYWRETAKLWRATRDSVRLTKESLIIDLFMRMVEYRPPSDEMNVAWTQWAFKFLVAMGVCVSEELGDKLADIVRTMSAVRTGVRDERIEIYKKKIKDLDPEQEGDSGRNAA